MSIYRFFCRIFFVTTTCTCLLGLLAGQCDAQPGPPREPLTIAESSDFTATATGEEVREFLTKISSKWAGSQLGSVGRSLEGRQIDMLVVPAIVRRNSDSTSSGDTAALTVLILGGIHSGECDGKEALLALARDLSQNEDNWYRRLNLIFIPNFNADADARRGKEHRPGQVGPTEGMGVRENAQGLDLNRDFIKLETPEVRALVKTIHELDVDVLIDMHTTNGSLHRYPLTYDIPHNPAMPANIDRYLRDELMPAVTGELTQQGIDTFYYGNFNGKHDRWETYGHEPRYSTEYVGLRGKIGILVESYSYADYKTRIDAGYRFVDQVLRRLAQDSKRIRQMMEEQTKSNQVGAVAPIAGKLAKTADAVTALGYQKPDGTPPPDPYIEKPATGLQPQNYRVELWNSTEVTQKVRLPAAYAIDPQYAWAVSRLVAHGLNVSRLTESLETDVEWAEITKVSTGPTLQGHGLKNLEATWQPAKRILPKGTYIVQSTGPLAKLAAYLLEPMSDESLATWNFLDPYLSDGAEYPAVRMQVVPTSTEDVSSVEPGEAPTFNRMMKPGETIDLSSGNQMRSFSWSENASKPEYSYLRERQRFIADAETGGTRRLEINHQLEAALAKLETFTSSEAHEVASRFHEGMGGSDRKLIEHKGDLYLYDAASQTARRVTDSPDKAKAMVEINSTGRHAAFVRDNNLWLVDCQSATESPLTENGSTELLNGILDWVYQEELYGRGNFKAFWWSPDGRYLTYLQLDQTEVPEYIVLDSTGVQQTVERTRYPKSGDPNPKVKVIVVDVNDKSSREIDLSAYSEDDRLVGRVSWSPDNQLWLQVFNRVQNRQDLVRVDPKSGQSKAVLHEQTEGWIEIRGTPRFLADGSFLWLSDIPNGRTHLYHVDAGTGNRKALTSGDWDATEVLTVTTDEKTVFVYGNLGSPIEKHLVAVDLKAATYKKLTEEPGTHDVSVDPTGAYFIDTFSSVTMPPVTLLNSTDGTLVRILSAPTRDRHLYLQAQTPKLLTIPTRDGLPLQAQVMLPWGVDFDSSPESNSDTPGRLPVLFYVYGGPQNPTVHNSWRQRDHRWHQSLCAQGYAVVLCDNRSARGRGVGDSWTIRGNMGRVELQDLEDAVAWVGKQPWADPERIGVWGWSYGGFMTAYALTHSQLFKAGISGAPVTDWHNYDSIYTERYMDLPEPNQDGYKSTSVVGAAEDLHGRLMLIHGERDDNVHLSNTLQLANALQAAGKHFDLMIYPRARHGVVDPRQSFQMYQMMTEFLEKNLKE